MSDSEPRRQSDRWQQRLTYLLVILIFVQGLANMFLYAVTLYSQYRFYAYIDAAEQVMKLMQGLQ